MLRGFVQRFSANNVHYTALLSKLQKTSNGENTFVKWKGTSRSNWYRTVQSGPPSEVVLDRPN